MLLLTLRETYALNRLSSFKNLRRKGGKFDHCPGRPKPSKGPATPLARDKRILKFISHSWQRFESLGVAQSACH